ERAVEAVLSIGSIDIGTLDGMLAEDNHYYFIEMNTGLQVEHPVNELVTRIDLVQMQLRVAAGERLPFKQTDIEFRGHAIEFRITAEDPRYDFRPQTGVIEEYLPPSGPGVRVDSHL